METVTPLAARNQIRPGPRPRLREVARHPVGVLLVGAALCGLVACKPAMVVGEYKCPDNADGDPPPSTSAPVSVPWETGFENGPCDYTQVAGTCYGWPPLTFRVVDQPVHSGQYAVEITVVTGTDGGLQPQGRCIREGVLPVEAYYGAWFLLPHTLTVPASGLWNLFHFRRDAAPRGLWDVHLKNAPTGELSAYVYSRFLNADSPLSPPVPIGSWFHVVFYLKRAKDTSGAVALYLDDQKVFESTNLVTDDSDRGQWYVGSLASELQPPEATVYVDDVTIRSTP